MSGSLDRKMRVVSRRAGQMSAKEALPSDFADFRAMSARVGGDPSLTQGSGGNTSIKSDGVLRVKASGRWLADADREDVFVALPQALLLERIAYGNAEDLRDLIMTTYDGGPARRASIETAFHAVMPQRIVLHAHPLNGVATSTLADSEQRFRRALQRGVRGTVVPYRRPGTPLAREVANALSNGPVDVLLLQNHGVIVGAETAEEAEAMLLQLERGLALPDRVFPRPDEARVASLATAEYHADLANSDIALDEEVVRYLSSAALVPDQVVFLGGAVCVANSDTGILAAADRIEESVGIRPVLVIVAGIGLYRRNGRSQGAQAVIDGLLGVARRLPSRAVVRGLSGTHVAELLDWDAEHHRQQLDRKRA